MLRQVWRVWRGRLGRCKLAVQRRCGWVGTSWQEALPEELNFWANALADPGKYWLQSEFDFRMNPASELQPELRQLWQGQTPAALRILDVGAGPLTTLGKKWPGCSLAITAVDPLAAEYDQILARLKLTPPVRTTRAEGEKLDAHFAEGQFHLAYASNALDHARDPLAAIRQMVRVVEPGGWVYLWHFANEGATERYHGLHQWNFEVRGGEFLIGDGRQRLRLQTELGATAQVACEEQTAFNKRVVIAKIRKAQA